MSSPHPRAAKAHHSITKGFPTQRGSRTDLVEFGQPKDVAWPQYRQPARPMGMGPPSGGLAGPAYQLQTSPWAKKLPMKSEGRNPENGVVGFGHGGLHGRPAEQAHSGDTPAAIFLLVRRARFFRFTVSKAKLQELARLD